MQKLIAIKKYLVITVIIGLISACNNNHFDINKAHWTQAMPYISYTLEDSLSTTKADAGKLKIEFYGWYKKGTVVSAFSSDEMKSFIDLIESQLINNLTFSQLAKKTKGYIKFDVNQYLSTETVFENGLPVFRFTIQ